jgi:hypothetical protein
MARRSRKRVVEREALYWQLLASGQARWRHVGRSGSQDRVSVASRAGRNPAVGKASRQDGAANGGGTSYRPAPGKAEQRTRGDAVVPFGGVLRRHEVLREQGVGRGAHS